MIGCTLMIITGTFTPLKFMLRKTYRASYIHHTIGNWMPVHFRPLCQDPLTKSSPTSVENRFGNWQNSPRVQGDDSTSFCQKKALQQITLAYPK